jgi:hypothetical protein
MRPQFNARTTLFTPAADIAQKRVPPATVASPVGREQRCGFPSLARRTVARLTAWPWPGGYGPRPGLWIPARKGRASDDGIAKAIQRAGKGAVISRWVMLVGVAGLAITVFGLRRRPVS